MSETTNTETAVLLPTATVDLFIKDKATAEAARSLVDDWRFARVTVSVEEGDVESAIQAYKSATSASLVIIETDTTDESFTARLGELSQYCAEGTQAIVIGPVNDVNLYRNLTSMGVSDYLVRPVPLATLSEVIAKSLIAQLGASGSRLVAVIGAKGGVGTSSLAQIYALALSEKMGQKTFLLDAAGGWSTLSIGLGFEPVAKISEAARHAGNKDLDSMKRMIAKVSDKLSVLATGTEAMMDPMIEGEDYEALIDLLMTSYPVVIVDLSAAKPSLKKAVLAKSHQIILAATPTLPSLRAARTLIQEIKVMQGGSLHGLDLVITMAGLFASKEVPKQDIKTVMGREPAAIIPFDPKIFMGAEAEGKKVTEMKGGEELLALMLPLAEKIVKAGNMKADLDAKSSKDKGLFDQVINKLKSR